MSEQVIEIDTVAPSEAKRDREQEFKERVFDCTDDPPAQQLKFTISDNTTNLVMSNEQHPSIKQPQSDSKVSKADEQPSKQQKTTSIQQVHPERQRPQPGARRQPRAMLLEDLPMTEHRFWKNTSATYLMMLTREFQFEDPKGFQMFMASGAALLEYAEIDELDGFQKVFAENTKNERCKNLMYYHIQRAFRVAVRHRSLQVIEHIIEDLDLDLRHECFGTLIHSIVMHCAMSEGKGDEDLIEVNRQMVRYIVQGMKREVNLMDKVNASTPLHVACDMSTDLTLVQILVEGGCDVNAVNSDNWMPLSLVQKRIQESEDVDYDLLDIEHYLKVKGAKRDWRTN